MPLLYFSLTSCFLCCRVLTCRDISDVILPPKCQVGGPGAGGKYRHVFVVPGTAEKRRTTNRRKTTARFCSTGNRQTITAILNTAKELPPYRVTAKQLPAHGILPKVRHDWQSNNLVTSRWEKLEFKPATNYSFFSFSFFLFSFTGEFCSVCSVPFR